MKDKTKIRLLQLIMVAGLSLILLGHYLISYVHLPEKWGVKGIIVSAMCIAIGIIMSLPTKIYLTILLMQREK